MYCWGKLGCGVTLGGGGVLWSPSESSKTSRPTFWGGWVMEYPKQHISREGELTKCLLLLHLLTSTCRCQQHLPWSCDVLARSLGLDGFLARAGMCWVPLGKPGQLPQAHLTWALGLKSPPRASSQPATAWPTTTHGAEGRNLASVSGRWWGCVSELDPPPEPFHKGKSRDAGHARKRCCHSRCTSSSGDFC